MKTFLLILGAVFLILTIIVIVQYSRAKPRRRKVINDYSGELGSGKTYLTISELCGRYRELMKKYNRHFRWYWRIIPKSTVNYMPRAYTNIPVYLGKYKVLYKNKKGRIKKKYERVWSYVLKREHLLLQEPFPSDIIPLCVLDEAGTVANQYSYNDLNIVSHNINDDSSCLEMFMRFFRHYYGEHCHDMCWLGLTDQASGDLCIAIRRRLGSVDLLSNFHRFLFLPFYKVSVRTLLLTEDSITNLNETEKDKDKREEYYFGFLPYKWWKINKYDSHCYSGGKNTGYISKVDFDVWSDNDYYYHDDKGVIISKMKTNYIPDLRMTDDEKRIYKNKLEKMGIDENTGKVG